MFFKQIKYRGDNFSYIIADDVTKDAVVVDPSFNAEGIVRLLREKNLSVKFVINTHGHIDHTADNEYIKSNFSAKIVAHKLSEVKKDVSVTDGDIVNLGGIHIKVIHTPGHTPDGICLLVDGKLLTGDTLFVGECGRTDLPGSSPEKMYHSLHRLIELDDNIEIYPGHDYGVKPSSTIGIEKKTNYTLENRTLDEFLEFMSQP